VWWGILAKAQFCGNALLKNYCHEHVRSGPTLTIKKTSAKYFIKK
jgi:hypothetical protein